MAQWKTGDLVRVSYKSGEYVAEVLEEQGAKLLVRIAAVLTYPTQGDLHHPYEADVPLFHQRRALAYQEKIMIPAHSAAPYHGSVPDYGESVQRALQTEIDKLEKTIRWAERCLVELRNLQKESFTNKA
jgi:kinase-associated protein B